MEARYVALLILSPFALVFIYATWLEYRRFKTEGPSNYGLSYDPETNTTSVGTIAEDERSFDLGAYDPDRLETAANARQTDEDDGDDGDEAAATAHDADDADADRQTTG